MLAGFVEPGESVEETVAREVCEETAVEVEDVRYFGRQPWPYPHSLMLGFQARWRAGEIRVDGREIEDAGWFAADAMPMTFPGNVSISQWLIRDFLVATAARARRRARSRRDRPPASSSASAGATAARARTRGRAQHEVVAVARADDLQADREAACARGRRASSPPGATRG